MTSILDALDNVQQALAAQQFALNVTQRNIANADNPSYTRQSAIFTNDETSIALSGIPGVYIESSRNHYLDYSISKEIQASEEYDVMSEALKQIEAVLSAESGQGLQQAFTDFFGDLNRLTSTPEDLIARQQVLTSAEALTSEFHRIHSGLQQLQISEDRRIPHILDEINTLTAEIASMNSKIPSAESDETGTAFILRDERQQCLEKLSGLMGIAYYETESGEITVTTKQGEALVLGNQSFNLETGPDPSGSFTGIQLNGTDITQSIGSGKLGGLIQVRDGTIADCLGTLDDMAANLIARVNEQHALGSDLDGAAGGDFFTPFTQSIPGSNEGAAWQIQVAITDARLIAAADAGAGPGNNENAQRLASIEDEKLFSSSTETIMQFYSGYIYRIGNEARTAEDQAATHLGLIQQLKNQRDAVIGVNLDEEAINIIKFQKAYQASARYANTAIALSDEIIRLLGG